MQVLLLCAGGMSSSLMAKKVSQKLKEEGQEIEVTARGINFGRNELRKEAAYDLYLISPQVRMYFKDLKELADSADKPLVQVPASAYVPLPRGIEALSNLILDQLT